MKQDKNQILRDRIAEYMELGPPIRLDDVPGGRCYTRDKEILKYSVTTPLNAVSKGLGYDMWLGNSFGYEAAMEWGKFTADRGTRVHLNAGTLLAGIPIQTWFEQEDVEDMPIFEVKCLQGFIKWHHDNKPEILANEMCLFHEDFPVAGTADLICLIKGELWLIDLKTGKHYPIHQLQLTAYGMLFKKLFHRKPKLATLRLYEYRRDVKYDWREYKYDWPTYQKVLDLWQWLNKPKPQRREMPPKILSLDMLEEKEE